MQPGPSGRAIGVIVALIIVVGLAMLAGAALSYVDEHSGAAAKARVTKCTSRGHGKTSTVHCIGTWSVAGRTMTGSISNGRLSDEGKTVSIRVHGERATKPTLWISIAAALLGLALTATGIWLAAVVRRQGSLASGSSSDP